MAALLFYLLTLAESIEFINRDAAKGWYAAAILVLAILLVLEVVTLTIYWNQARSNQCTPSLQFNDMYGQLYNEMIQTSTSLRYFGALYVMFCIVGSLYAPQNCMGDGSNCCGPEQVPILVHSDEHESAKNDAAGSESASV